MHNEALDLVDNFCRSAVIAAKLFIKSVTMVSRDPLDQLWRTKKFAFNIQEPIRGPVIIKKKPGNTGPEQAFVHWVADRLYRGFVRRQCRLRERAFFI